MSLTAGFTLPFKFEIFVEDGKACRPRDGEGRIPSVLDCSNLSLASCPATEDLGSTGALSLQVVHPETNATVGCYSPCSKLTQRQWANSAAEGSSLMDASVQEFCCSAPTAFAQHSCPAAAASSFAQLLHQGCPAVKGYEGGDGVGALRCPDDTNYKVTFFCPAPKSSDAEGSREHSHDANSANLPQLPEMVAAPLRETHAPILQAEDGNTVARAAGQHAKSQNDARVFEQPTRFRITNGCTREPIWIAHEAGAGVGPDPQNVEIAELGSYDFTVPAGLSGTRYWPKLRCDATGGACRLGESGGPQQHCGSITGCAPPVDTKFEASFGLNGEDWVDISLVDGFTLPFKFEIFTQTGKSCAAGDGNRHVGNVVDCSHLSFNLCPTSEDLGVAGRNVDLRVRDPDTNRTVGCYSPCSKLTLNQWDNAEAQGRTPWDDGVKEYCCPTPPESPDACRQGPVGSTSFVRAVHKGCPGVYGYAYDDGMGLLKCPDDTKYRVTFYCPHEDISFPGGEVALVPGEEGWTEPRFGDAKEAGSTGLAATQLFGIREAQLAPKPAIAASPSGAEGALSSSPAGLVAAVALAAVAAVLASNVLIGRPGDEVLAGSLRPLVHYSSLPESFAVGGTNAGFATALEAHV